jgi:hypothetical protein
MLLIFAYASDAYVKHEEVKTAHKPWPQNLKKVL